MLYTPDEYLQSDNHLGKTALLMSPSITPIYENSPAFRLFAINQREGNLYNYTQYYMDLALSNGKKIERFVVLLILFYVIFGQKVRIGMKGVDFILFRILLNVNPQP